MHDHTVGTQTLNEFHPESKQSLGEVSQKWTKLNNFPNLKILGNLDHRQLGDTKKPLDDNCATHLIRNALGGVSGGLELQYARLEETLMLPPGMARNYRDDITVIVVHFNQQFLFESTDSD